MKQPQKTKVDYIIFATKQAKESVAFGISQNHSCRNLKACLLQYWQNKTLGLHNTAQKKRIPRSKAALKLPLDKCRVEHAVPFTVIVNKLMTMKPLTPKAVTGVLRRWYSVMLVTQDEDVRLRKAGLRYRMPANWDEKDVFARYKAVKIEIPKN